MNQSSVDFARQSKKQMVLETLKPMLCFHVAYNYGIVRIQGFLYKPLFIPVNP